MSAAYKPLPRDSSELAFDKDVAVKRAEQRLSSMLSVRKSPAYPMQALGPLAAACEAITIEGQVQPAMAGQCVLSAASLLTQGLNNIESLSGTRPLSLYLMSLGDSGDGKSTAQSAAFWAVHEWQRKANAAFTQQLEEHGQARAARKKGDDSSPAPASPYRLVGDATVEGLRRDLDNGPCAQGVISDEAAAMLCGYGMSVEQRAKSSGVFAKLWDNGHLSVSRATGGRVERYGRRLCMHLLIQPAAAAETLGDPLLASLGFWPRFLIAWPDPQPPRLARGFRPESSRAITTYWARCRELLDQPLPDDAGDQPTIPLTTEARALLGKAFERFEQEGRRGKLQTIKPFALRATEQACRLAGVLAAFAGDSNVTQETAASALELTAYSLETWKAVIADGVADQDGRAALKLYAWLIARPGWRESLSVVVNAGPSGVRTRDKRDAALSLLTDAGLVEVAQGTAFAVMPGASEGQQ